VYDLWQETSLLWAYVYFCKIGLMEILSTGTSNKAVHVGPSTVSDLWEFFSEG
jgi:hypothetical protein